MAGAGLADIINVRVMIAFASILLFGAAAYALVAPGLGSRLAARRARPARGRCRRAPALAAAAVPAGDAGRLRPAGRASCRRSPGCRAPSARRSCATRAIREVPAGTRIVEHGDTASSAYFILDGSATAGIPEDGRLPRPVDDAGRRLLRRDRGPDRQPADGRRRRRHGHDAARGARRRAARHDARARDPAARVLDARRRACSGPRRPTCRVSPARTRRRCATCARRARASRPRPRSSSGEATS